MPANRGFPSTPSRNDAGFSVLELMVALLLFSTLGIAVWSGLAGGQNLVRKSIRLAAGTARLLQMELLLRRAAAQVRTPYWLPDPGAEATAGGLRIPWLHGLADQSLYLSWGEGRLRVRTGEQDPGIAFSPFAVVDCEVYQGGPGEAAGLRVAVLPDEGDGEPLLIAAPFGGSPPGVGP